MPEHRERTPSGELFAELDSKILALGGERVVRRPDEDQDFMRWIAAELLARGQLFTLPVKERLGRPSSCHINALAIWGRNIEKYEMVTGFALKGGIWRHHSWVVDKKCLYETTTVAEKYFGAILNRKDAFRWWFEKYLQARYPGPMSMLIALTSEQKNEC